MRKRELLQVLGIVFCFILYLIGKEYLKSYDYLDTTNGLLGFYNRGLLIPISAIGFSIVAFSIAGNVPNQKMSKLDRIISGVIYFLLNLLGLAIIFDFFMTNIFSDPIFLPTVGILIIIGYFALINRRESY